MSIKRNYQQLSVSKTNSPTLSYDHTKHPKGVFFITLN